MMNAIVGFLTGVLASMGLGGGFILIIWLTVFLDMEQRAAQGINLLFFLPIALLSLIMHLKNGLVNKKLVARCITGGVIGAVLGSYASTIITGGALRKLFALFLLAFGLREIFRKSEKSGTNNDQTNHSTKRG